MVAVTKIERVRGNAPTRSMASATLGWAMVNIPVGFYSGTEQSKISRSMFTPNGNPAKQRWVDAETEQEFARGDLVKKMETANGWVELSDDEISVVLSNEGGRADIEEFRSLDDWYSGDYFYDGVIQVRPAKSGTGKNRVIAASTSKAFKLLVDTMQAENVFALVRYVMRGRTNYGALMPNGDMFTLVFDHDVRARLPMPDVEYSDAEFEMGRKLVKQVISKRKRDALINDDYTRVLEYAEAKAKGDVAEPTQPAVATDTQDLVAALEASLSK